MRLKSPHLVQNNWFRNRAPCRTRVPASARCPVPDVLLPLLTWLQQLLLELQHAMHQAVEVAGLRASQVRSRITQSHHVCFTRDPLEPHSSTCASMHASMPGCHIERPMHTRRSLWAFERNPKPKTLNLQTTHSPRRFILCVRQERR